MSTSKQQQTPKLQDHQPFVDAQEKLNNLKSDFQTVKQRLRELSEITTEQQAERILRGEPHQQITWHQPEIETLRIQLQALHHAIQEQEKIVSKAKREAKLQIENALMPEHKKHIKAMTKALTAFVKAYDFDYQLWANSEADKPLSMIPNVIDIRRVKRWLEQQT